MSYIQTASGRKFDLSDYSMSDFHIEDIAQSLSNICRFAGHVPKFYSVAQHSLIMSWLAPKPLKLQALLHDASEAYLGDVPRHVKQLLGDKYYALEAELMYNIASQFRFSWPMAPEIKELDGDMLETEFRQVFGRKFAGCPVYGKQLDVIIEPWYPSLAKTEFLKAFHSLS